jgi:hypothetical protein
VKDLWGLYLSTLTIKIPDNTKFKKQDSEDDYSGDEMAFLKDEQSSEEEQLDNEAQHHKRGDFRSDIQALKKYPTLILSPLFSYLAIITLKLPVSLKEIYQYPSSSCVN